MTADREDGPGKGRRSRSRDEDPRLYEALGRVIKSARSERGLERKDLAEASDLSYAYLSDIESGRRRASSSALFHIARILGMSPSELMQWTEEITDRMASEETGEEGIPSTPAEAPARAGPPEDPGPTHRRSWFSRASVDAESVPARPASGRSARGAGSQASVQRKPMMLELSRVLDDLGPEDLELVIDLARRLAREQPPPG